MAEEVWREFLNDCITGFEVMGLLLSVYLALILMGVFGIPSTQDAIAVLFLFFCGCPVAGWFWNSL